jgi:hypothetical protein
MERAVGEELIPFDSAASLDLAGSASALDMAFTEELEAIGGFYACGPMGASAMDA